MMLGRSSGDPGGYTPVEVVDFIIHSADVALKKHFGSSVSDHDVQILDPFTGTGTFMVRLLQSDLIHPEDLKHKYVHELHANEIVLLAYYIAAINIESSYHALIGEYHPFDGIVLTDIAYSNNFDYIGVMTYPLKFRRKVLSVALQLCCGGS